MRGVPVLAPKHQAFVCSEVRNKSLATMSGIANTEDETEKEQNLRADAENAAEGAAEPGAAPEAERICPMRTQLIKKRKLAWKA